MVGAVVVRRWVQWWRDGGCSGGETVGAVVERWWVQWW